MRIVADLDGTLCTNEQGVYILAKPQTAMILRLNECYDKGHRIVIHTGRSWDALELTQMQLKEWGVKHHTLIMGKPPADIVLDDKALSFQDFLK